MQRRGRAGARPRHDYERARQRLVAGLRARGTRDERVLAALGAVPRHVLVPDALWHRAYRDAPLPIGEGQTISAPSTVARMSEALELAGCERVLEVGTGSAYQAAVLARLAAEVISIERLAPLVARAAAALARLGAPDVEILLGDGSLGLPERAPFDAIVVTAGGPRVPRPLLEQLAPGGRLVGPFGPRGRQALVRVRRGEGDLYLREVLGPCRFVDLRGEHGWAA